jgi:hypothetical protein
LGLGPKRKNAAPLARRGASKTLLGSSEKTNQASKSFLYLGRQHCGFIAEREAFDLDGRSLGTWLMLGHAVAAVMAAFDKRRAA